MKVTEETTTIQYLPSHFKPEIPELDEYNEEYVLGFLIGYFAADGSVDEREELIWDVQMMTFSFDLKKLSRPLEYIAPILG